MMQNFPHYSRKVIAESTVLLETLYLKIFTILDCVFVVLFEEVYLIFVNNEYKSTSLLLTRYINDSRLFPN